MYLIIDPPQTKPQIKNTKATNPESVILKTCHCANAQCCSMKGAFHICIVFSPHISISVTGNETVSCKTIMNTFYILPTVKLKKVPHLLPETILTVSFYLT